MLITYIFIAVLLVAAFCATYVIFQYKKNPQGSCAYFIDGIPSVFVTIGVLGTFLGIVLGLQDFNTEDISGSIPGLLEGLKSAFYTSIAGMFLSLVFAKFIDGVNSSLGVEGKQPETGELSALNQLIKQQAEVSALLIKSFERQNDFYAQDLEMNKRLQNQLAQQHQEAKANQALLLEKQAQQHQGSLSELQTINMTMVKELGRIEEGQKDLLSTMEQQELRHSKQRVAFHQELLAEEKESRKILGENTQKTIVALNKNHELMAEKFDNFAELLKKNNTEALVDVMKKVTEEFNAQMKELIDRLVKENFDELNKSVQSLNQWQQEHKEQVQSLTNVFTKLNEDYQEAYTGIRAKLEQAIEGIKQSFEQSTQKITVGMRKSTNQIEKDLTSLNTVYSESTQQASSEVQNLWTETTRELGAQLQEVNQSYEAETQKLIQSMTKESLSSSKQIQKGIKELNSEAQEAFASMLNQLQLLVQENNQLHDLIAQLRAVMSENVFEKITQALKEAAVENKATADTMNKWVKHNKNLFDNIPMLITQMGEMMNDKSQHWENVRTMLKDSANSIRRATNVRDEQYQKWLANTLSNLDDIMTRYLLNSRKN